MTTNTKNLKLMSYDELKYLDQKYMFNLSDDKKSIILTYSDFPSKQTLWNFGVKDTLLFNFKYGNQSRRSLVIQPVSKKIFLEKDGKWNLFIIQQMVNTLLFKGILIDTVSSEMIEKYYKEIELKLFIMRG